MTILLLAEHNNKALSDQTAKALAAAHQIGGDVDILVCGKNAMAVAEEAAKLHNVRKVLLAEADYLEHQLAEPVAATLNQHSGEYDVIMAAATANGKNIMPRVAALLDVMQISDVIEIVSDNTFKRPIYAGNAIETVQTADPKKVITVRTASLKAAACDGNAKIEQIDAAADPHLSHYVDETVETTERPDLTAAKIVVSGGRGLGSEENFNALLLPLADKLGAAIGASRAAVEAGYAPNDWQVGQTGKVVAPELYIAVAISGAIQHLAGMKDSKIIVAINKDEDAPIMHIADYALVADLFDVIPELEKAL